MNYTNREVVRRLKQYDMFLNSLNLTTDEVQRERICDQLDKIEKQILLETNAEYESQYMLLLGEETKFFSEEKTKLRKLISLVTDRKKYLDERKNKHREVTGSLVELTTFLGEDKLTTFKKRLDIIEKYEENKVKKDKLIKEMKMLDVKLSEASRTIKANGRLNDILENKMISAVTKALEKLNLFSLNTRRDDIYRSYETYEYALSLAKDNLDSATKLGNTCMIEECNTMLDEVTSEYSKYNEMINILKLIDIYDKKVSNYEELLNKREELNDILKNITGSKLYNEIYEELNKEYNTIKLEKQDVENYESLKKEREVKNKELYEIEEENNSSEFKSVIEELVKNENRVREEKIKKAKKEEYQERQKKLLEEKKIEESRLRRQKLIEEARLKEQQERITKVKELQDKTVINHKKEDKITKVEKAPTVKMPEVKKEIDPFKEEEMNNPLKNKTFDEIINNSSDDFNSSELFENTKIVPNKVVKEEKTLFDVVEDSLNLTTDEEPKLDLPVEPLVNEVMPSIPPIGESVEKTTPLFKEETTVKDIAIKDKTPDVKEDKVPKEPSIYDILENNQNIIWKTTDTSINKDTIPVIANNNLKPETLNSKNVNDIAFPKLDSKEADILWKETL